jgi:uncharacterized protein (DUF2267 family)
MLRSFGRQCLRWRHRKLHQGHRRRKGETMSQLGLTEFDTSVHKTNVWLKDLMARMNWSDRHRAYRALRIVLQSVRDHLPVEQVAALGAQLPLIIRGAYYEGWHPAGKPLKYRRREDFLNHLDEQFGDAEDESQPIAEAVFSVMNARLSEGLVNCARHCLPEAIRALWPDPCSWQSIISINECLQPPRSAEVQPASIENGSSIKFN